MTHGRPSHFEKAQQKRYAARAFRNPYFQPRERPRWIPLLIAAAALLLVMSGLWASLTVPAFAIRAVRIEGNETITTETIAQTVQTYLDESFLWVFRRSNRFLFRTETLVGRLQAAYPLDAVTINRDASTLEVHIRERASELLWQSGNDVYLADRAGRVLQILTAEEVAPRLKRLHAFTDVNRAPVHPGDQVLKPEEIAGAFAFEQSLLDAAIPFVEVRVDREAGEWMAAKTFAGYDILFDPLQDTGQQVLRLQTLLRETVKDTKTVTYVDLRFGDHVYYK